MMPSDLPVASDRFGWSPPPTERALYLRLLRTGGAFAGPDAGDRPRDGGTRRAVRPVRPNGGRPRLVGGRGGPARSWQVRGDADAPSCGSTSTWRTSTSFWAQVGAIPDRTVLVAHSMGG